MSPSSGAAPHVPVLLAEVVEALAPVDGGVYVDGTFGAGGYTRAILSAANCQVFAVDRDPLAQARGRQMAGEFSGRLTMVAGRFGEMDGLLEALGVSKVNGVALDIGVSSMQIDAPERGFSFRTDGPLDMRMEGEGYSAADAVNSLEEAALADVIYAYGEERASRRVARAIVARRAERPFTRTSDLAEVVRSAVRPSKDGIDPATRTFQALRIHVNDELGELERGLEGAERLLVPGGRLAVVTFHSLEDRIVKNFLRQRSGEEAGGSRHLPEVKARRIPSFQMPQRRGVRPGEVECRANSRARSAKLRWAVRTDAPAWSLPVGGEGARS
ncbi:MAG: 16S rRNA (cytosine(1402)-N(4))-methyltransferase [Alphaproteobacteria bacterium RIFOXYD12_FULL_60_8]|nr:MAG: 16S rRNA (cytosine(1402)-N(4))-methyltransferase [Alphaproteobacteria bacterium RIFOXYD12_FULL_60_8]